jgi:hypothetical protein
MSLSVNSRCGKCAARLRMKGKELDTLLPDHEVRRAICRSHAQFSCEPLVVRPK